MFSLAAPGLIKYGTSSNGNVLRVNEKKIFCLLGFFSPEIENMPSFLP